MPKLESQSEKEKMSSVSASSSTESTAIVDEISRASQNNNTDGQSRPTHVAVEETLFFAVAPLRTSPLVEMTSSEKIKAYCNEGGPVSLRLLGCV